MSLPIRTRLVLTTSGLILVIVLLLSGFLHWRLVQYLESDFHHYAAYEAREFAEVIEDGCSERRFAEFTEHEIKSHPTGLKIFVQLRSPQGELIYASENLGTHRLEFPASIAPAGYVESRSILDIDDVHEARVITVPVKGALAPRGEATYFVQIAFDDAPRARILKDHLLSILYVVVLTTTLAISAGWVLASQAMQPVHALIQHAERIGAANLSDERLPVRGTGDELDRLAQVLNTMLGRLDGAVRTVQRFTADAAHELRTPLTTIRGELELLVRHPESFDPESIESVLEEIGRLNALCSRLLLLARLDEMRHAVERRVVSLDQLLDRIVDQMRPLADSHRIDLGWRGDPEILVSANEDLLSQAFLNLLDNAVKHTPPGGRIDVEARAEGGSARVRVTDTGRGIAAEHLPKLFDRFYRVRDSVDGHASPGSGLGLAIVREVVEVHQGQVGVKSVPGRGTTFELTLPLAPREAPVPAAVP